MGRLLLRVVVGREGPCFMFSFASRGSSLKNRRQLSQGGWSHNFHDPGGCFGAAVPWWAGG